MQKDCSLLQKIPALCFITGSNLLSAICTLEEVSFQTKPWFNRAGFFMLLYRKEFLGAYYQRFLSSTNYVVSLATDLSKNTNISMFFGVLEGLPLPMRGTLQYGV